MVLPQNLYSSNADRQFHLEEMIDWKSLGSLRPADAETYRSLLNTVGEVAGKSIAGRAQKNNEEKYAVKEGKLIWPQGIKDSYADIVNLGLNAATVDEKYGGLGLPFFVNMIALEMLFQADAGFATIPGLQAGVADLIETFASEELKQKYLPLMTSGKYTGAMDLTETQAGSDLGRVKTKAVATGIEGVVLIDGEKIFITNGGADVHVVLARDAEVYEQTMGSTKGISLYLVPREIEDQSNGVSVERVEEKRGLHSSPTCAMRFEKARGYRIGEKGKGIKYMFLLMNKARLSIAAQALGILEGAYAEAFSYAQQREQFGKKITQHSLVQKMLEEICVHKEAIRSALYPAAFAVDMEEELRKKILATDQPEKKQALEEQAKQYSNRAAVLTFGLKYYAAEQAIALTQKALKIHGGMGYMQETEVGRYLSDSLITAIYEGTSEIQASQLLDGAVKAQIFGTSRSDVRLLMDEVEQGLDCIVGDVVEDVVKEGTSLRGELRKASALVREVMEFLGHQVMHFTSEGMNESEVANLVVVKAKELTEMTVEVYAGYQLLLQAQKNERKKSVAKAFITEEMLPNILRNARRIKNLKRDTLEKYDEILSG